MAFQDEPNVNHHHPGLFTDTDALLAPPFSGERSRDADGIRPKDDDDPNMAQWAGQPSVKGSSESMRMALLSFSIIGLQYVYDQPESW
jgi:hypothetical protein